MTNKSNSNKRYSYQSTIYQFCEPCKYYYTSLCKNHDLEAGSKKHRVRKNEWIGKLLKIPFPILKGEVNIVYISYASFYLTQFQEGELVTLKYCDKDYYVYVYPSNIAHDGQILAQPDFLKMFNLSAETLITLIPSPEFSAASFLSLSFNDGKKISKNFKNCRESILSALHGVVLSPNICLKISLLDFDYNFTVQKITNFGFDSNTESHYSSNDSDYMESYKVPLHADKLESFYIVSKTETSLIVTNQEIATKSSFFSESDFSSNLIKGVDKYIKYLNLYICYPLTKYHVFNAIGSFSPIKGLILHGLPCCGKSSIVKKFCFDNSLNLEICDCALSGFISDFFVSLSDNLMSHSANVILLRNAHLLNEKLFFMFLDTISNVNSRIFIVATTHDLLSLPQYFKINKIFELELEITLPDFHQRMDMLSSILSIYQHTLTTPDIIEAANCTVGFTPGDIQSLIKRSAYCACARKIESYGKLSITSEDISSCLSSILPSILHKKNLEVPKTSWADIGGLVNIKQQVKECVEWPLQHPDAFNRMGISPPSGLLLYGPPGNSKTMIARAIANFSGLNFFSVCGPELFSRYVGDTEYNIRDLFSRARSASPSIIFFDEIDAFSSRKCRSENSKTSLGPLTQLLSQIDGLSSPSNRVIIVGATNRPGDLDPALLRRGRFDRLIYVPLPDLITRKEILTINTAKMPIDQSFDIDHLVKATQGFSGAELVGLCQEAALCALREDINSSSIEHRHFVDVLASMKPTVTQEQIEEYESFEAKHGFVL